MRGEDRTFSDRPVISYEDITLPSPQSNEFGGRPTDSYQPFNPALPPMHYVPQMVNEQFVNPTNQPLPPPNANPNFVTPYAVQNQSLPMQHPQYVQPQMGLQQLQTFNPPMSNTMPQNISYGEQLNYLIQNLNQMNQQPTQAQGYPQQQVQNHVWYNQHQQQ